MEISFSCIRREVNKLNVSRKEVEHVAALARLALSEEEKNLYTEQFNVILEYINRLNELKLENIDPMTHVQQLRNVLRKDIAKGSEKELVVRILEESPGKEKEKGFFSVPPVIE
jgi:aspartyl-tRNA(Asn)/glutamyl-tRNA(Gln) amidotransferase subunit C